MQSFYDFKSEDLSLLGRLDTPFETYETVLLGKKNSIYSPKWEETDPSKLNEEFLKISKKFFNEDDTANFLNRKIRLLCNASVMSLNHVFLDGPAKYYYKVQTSYLPEKEETETTRIGGLVARLRIKKSKPSNTTSTQQKYLSQCWDAARFSRYEEVFKDFNYLWKTKCKEIIQNLLPSDSAEEKTNIYSRLIWVFQKLKEIEENPSIKGKIPENTINLIDLFKPFIIYKEKNIEPIRYEETSSQTIDPEKSIQRISCQLQDDNFDSALERYILVKKIIQLQQIIVISGSLETYGHLDPVAFRQVKIDMLRQLSGGTLEDMKKFFDFEEYKRIAFSSSDDADESDMDTKTGSTVYTPKNSYYKFKSNERNTIH